MMASASTRILDNNLQLLFSTNHRTTHSRPCLFKADSIKNSYSLRSSWSPIKVTSSQGQHSAGNTPYVPKTDYQSSSSGNKYAVVSVSDKTDLPLIGRGLQNLGAPSLLPSSRNIFPFLDTVSKDAVEEACQSGIRVIAEHDEWSRRDEDDINCCNKYGVSLLCTKNIYYNLEH
ncbi:hypothetical protein TIFTF001_009032 [Ficus carica]|uniref:Uncharacterized protein n=1 Tax=Ficus carica TaxID=3494 RepID=A0AA87ZMF2_FICCA|nr:hypothetical protein TIFTF001_009032 [Ficus carica]